MKKSKFMLSVLAAAMFVTSAGALVACENQPDAGNQGGDPNAGGTGIVDVTLNGNGGTFVGGGMTKVVKTDANGHIVTEPAAPSNGEKVFTGYFVEQSETGTTKITYGDNGYKFSNAMTVYAHWKDPEPNQGEEEEGPGQGEEEEGTGPSGNSEYTITLDAGDGSCATSTLTTSGGKLTSLPTPTPPANNRFDGWFTAALNGTEVTTDTPFNSDGVTIYAHYSPIEQQQPVGPNSDPEPPAREYESSTITINGQTMTDTTSTVDRTWYEDPEPDGWKGYQNHTLADQFQASLTVLTETTYSFKVDNTAIGSVWVEYRGIKIKVGNTIYSTGGVKTSEFTLAKGTYTVYLKYYNDEGGSWNVWIEGNQEEEFDEQGVRPNVDPDPPAKVHTSGATINGQTMTDTTSTVDRTWYEDPEPDGWKGYQNHTLAEQYKASLTVTAETTYSFKADNTAIGSLWIERDTVKAPVQIKVDGVLIAAKGADGSSFTLAAGNYDVYLKYYHDVEENTESWTVWIEGTQEGSFDDQGGEGPTVDPDLPARVYTSAKYNGVAMEDNTANVSRVDKQGNPINTNLADEFKAHIELSEQTTITFTIGDNDKAASGMWVKHAQKVNVMINGVLIPYDGQEGTKGGANSGNGAIVLAKGIYDVYLTNYGTAGKDDFVLWVEGTQEGSFGDQGGEEPTVDPESVVVFTFTVKGFDKPITDVRIHMWTDDNGAYTDFTAESDRSVWGGVSMTATDDGYTFTYSLTLDEKGPVTGFNITFKQAGSKWKVAQSKNVEGTFSGGNTYNFEFDDWTTNDQGQQINWDTWWDVPFLVKAKE